MFHEIKITKQHIKNAKKKSDELGKLKNSIRAGEGNLTGFVGEEIVKEYLGIPTDDNTYQYDVIYEGMKLEVKSKDRTVPPRSDYNATVADFNTKQKCNYYVFTSIMKDKTRGWICGYIGKEEFYTRAKFNKKGDKETDIFNFKADCYNLPYDELADIKLLKKEASMIKDFFE